MKLQSLIRNSKKLSNFYKLQTDFLFYLYLLFSLNVVNELFRLTHFRCVKHRCFSNGLQRYALFLSLQIFLNFFFNFSAVNHFTGSKQPEKAMERCPARPEEAGGSPQLTDVEEEHHPGDVRKKKPVIFFRAHKRILNHY